MHPSPRPAVAPVAAAIILVGCASAPGPQPGRAPAAQVTTEDYARAESFLPVNVRELALNTTLDPHWSGDRLWYARETREGSEFVVVDARQGTSRPAFDHERLAAALSRAAGDTIPPTDLPVESIGLEQGRERVQLTTDTTTWTCELPAYTCREHEGAPEGPAGSVRSPDGRWDAFVRDHDLYLREVATGEEFRITQDGVEHYAYATSTEGSLNHVTLQRQGRAPEAIVLWSPDSRRLITQRLDERDVKDTHLLQMVPPEGVRPKLYTFRYPIPGDSALPMAEYFVVDTASKTLTPVQAPPVVDDPYSLIRMGRVWWGEDGERIYYAEHERGYTTIHLREVDAATGRTRTLLTERDTSYIDLNAFMFHRPNVRILGGGEEILWFSERDGWGQLYLYDGETGRLKHRVTNGEFLVRDIKHVDEDNRLVYFTAGGAEDGRDPYFRHLYRVRLDGSGLELLTPEDADHWVRFSPGGKYFVDTYAWGGHTPTTVLRTASGERVRTLEEADLSALAEKGWRWPERFRVKARDGRTDIYGVIYRPTNFDPSRSYPVLDNIYPGPQIIQSPLSMPGDPMVAVGQQHTAELGFIVVQIDGMGTPFRSRAFREVSYGNLGDAGGLADHVAALRQLAERYPSMDLERAGIYGHSGGGYASARGMLRYPELYKVGVSMSGNHDQRGYIAAWGEIYNGYPADGAYDDQANPALAENLEGRLLLIHGDMDDNVHPAHTMQLVDALIRSNRDFDMLLLPNRSHSVDGPYVVRRVWDYFVRHLRGEEPPEYQVGADKE